jgi:phage shock protein E
MFKILKSIFGSQPSVNFKELVAQGAWIIDVRSPEEFSQGHIHSSTNVPLQTIEKKATDLLKKNKTIITVCRSGTRSAMAKKILSAKGARVFNGGSWQSLQHKIS